MGGGFSKRHLLSNNKQDAKTAKVRVVSWMHVYNWAV